MKYIFVDNDTLNKWLLRIKVSDLELIGYKFSSWNVFSNISCSRITFLFWINWASIWNKIEKYCLRMSLVRHPTKDSTYSLQYPKYSIGRNHGDFYW